MTDDTNQKPNDLEETAEAEELVHEAFEGKKITKEEVSEIGDVEHLEKEADKIESQKAEFASRLETPLEAPDSQADVAAVLPKSELPDSAPVGDAGIVAEVAKEVSQEASSEVKLPEVK